MAVGRRLVWAVVGTAASKLTRRYVRRRLHTPSGATRLPRAARSRRGLGTALVFAVGTGALLAVADVLSEQGQDAARNGAD
jgi:hypothetical protein